MLPTPRTTGRRLRQILPIPLTPRLTTTMKGPDGKDKTEIDTIKTLDNTTFITEDDKGKVVEFRRKK